VIRASLLTDGASDRALIPILLWVLEQQSALPVELRWADLRMMRDPPQGLA